MSFMFKKLNSFINFLMTSKNLTLFWNFGSLLGLIFIFQSFSGLMMTLVFSNDSFNSFNSIQFMNVEINFGWFFHLMHMNFVSFFFMFIFLHLMKALFMSSFKLFKVWLVGVLIILILMLESFMGYVLIWSQMSFWACTVITGLLMVIPFIGMDLVYWIWGNFYVSYLTLKMFFLIHFIMPLIIIMFIFLHLFFLHFYLSTSNFYINSNFDKITFSPYFIYKDLMSLMLFMMMIIFILKNPFIFNDSEMFLESNYMFSPIHIVHEWYFLFAYDILRSIPNKMMGILMMIMSILFLLMLNPKNKKIYENQFSMKTMSFIFMNNIVLLSILGSKMVEPPFIIFGMIFSFFYFKILLMMILF